MKNYKSVLIIEDDVTFFLIRRILEIAGINGKVTGSENGFKALNFIKDEVEKGYKCPDLIILSLDMPLMNGVEFLNKLYEYNFNIKKIIILSDSIESDKKIIPPYKFYSFIEKSLIQEKLITALED